MADRRLVTSLLKISPLVVSLFSAGLLINCIQLALYLLVRPFSTRVYQKLFYYTTYWLLSHFLFLGEWWGGLDIVCYTDPFNYKYLGQEHSLFLLNHRYDIDWVAAFAFTDRLGTLGNCRAFAKKAIQKIPIIGWSLAMAGNVFLDRNWEKDRDVIGRQLDYLVQLPSPLALMITPEGTRFTRAKHEASQGFARERGLPELQHHLTPRTKGFTHAVPFIRGKVPAVYNMQMLFDQGKEPSIIGLLKGEKYVAHIYLERIPLDTIPEGDEALASWLHQLYQKKDRMTESFFKTGDLFKESGVPRWRGLLLSRRCWSLLSVVFWCVLTVGPLSYLVFDLLLAGSLALVFGVVAVGAVCGVFVLKLIRMTQISRGSSYGSTTTRNKGE